jgi:hypothetical protein
MKETNEAICDSLFIMPKEHLLEKITMVLMTAIKLTDYIKGSLTYEKV